MTKLNERMEAGTDAAIPTNDDYLDREEVIVDDYLQFKKYPTGGDQKKPGAVHGNEGEKEGYDPWCGKCQRRFSRCVCVK